MRTPGSPRAYQRAGWMVIFGLSLVLAGNSLFFGLTGADPEIFETDTGVAWSAFSDDYPTVATLVDLAERLNGTGYFGMSLFAAVVALFGLRKRARWSWYALWLFPAALLLRAGWFFTHDQPLVGGFYSAVAATAVVGLLLPFRLLFPGKES